MESLYRSNATFMAFPSFFMNKLSNFDWFLKEKEISVLEKNNNRRTHETISLLLEEKCIDRD